MTVQFTVRRLMQDQDAAAFRELRLEALQNAPEAFGSSYEAESQSSLDDFAGTLGSSYVAGACVGDRLVGTAGFYILKGTKVAHRGNVWGVYVDPAQRGNGIGRALLENVCAHAQGLVRQAHLSVVTGNAAALDLYRRVGFETYGTEPRSLLVDGVFHDEHLMVRIFD